MSYIDEEIILDRQTLIALAEKDSYDNRHPYGGILNRHKLVLSGICTFEFDKVAVWDDGVRLIKLEGPHMICLKIMNGIKLPDQSPFQHCSIKIERSYRF